MGAHTLPPRSRSPTPSGWRALVVDRAVVARRPAAAESLAYWDSARRRPRAGGVDGFIEAYDHDLDPGLDGDRCCGSPATAWPPSPSRGGRRGAAGGAALAALRGPRASSSSSTSRRSSSPATTRPTPATRTPSPRPGPSGSRGRGWSARNRASRRSPGRAAASRARSPPSASEPASQAALLGGTVLEPVDEPEARPGFVDRADLVVDQAVGEGELADDVLGQVGVDPGYALRPRDPEPAGGVQGAPQRREPLSSSARQW